MTYKQLVNQTGETATYPKELANIYLSLGLRGEYGEVCDKFKKLIRDDGWDPQADPYGKKIPKDKITGIILELGDVCWYVIRYCDEFKKGEMLEEHKEIDIEYLLPGTFDKAGILFNLNEMESVTHIGGYLTISVLDAIQNIAKYLGYSINEVFDMNYKKLISRAERGTSGGSGDYR